EGPHDAARLGADVGAAVAADLGLVAHAAEGDPHERAAEGAGDDSPSEVLPTPGGPTRAMMAPARRPPSASAVPRSARSLRTARNSTMRCFTSSRPVWSASSTARASARSRWSSERSPRGSPAGVADQGGVQAYPAP